MELNIAAGQKALVTLDNWFFAPDGRQYRAVFGTVRAVRTAEDSLGVKPNGRSTNWYLEIGNMTIAGCQVHYALRTENCHAGRAMDWHSDAQNGLKEFERPCSIYFADESQNEQHNRQP